MVPRAAVPILCLMFSLLLPACGGSSTPSAKTLTASPAQTGTHAQPPDAGGVRAALSALQLAIRHHDVNGTCASLLPGTATQARGSGHTIDAAISAQVRDCEAGFGQRGEFAGYEPLGTATVRRIDIRGRLAALDIESSHVPASVDFLYLRGRWRMLVTGS